jgi:hypothetical protein
MFSRTLHVPWKLLVVDEKGQQRMISKLLALLDRMHLELDQETAAR